MRIQRQHSILRDGYIQARKVKGILPDPLGHYQALLRALARLAGAYHGGVFAPEVMDELASHQGSLGVSERARYTAEQVTRRIARYREFAHSFPQLVPAPVRDPAFLDRLAQEAPRFCGHEAAIEHFLNAPSRMVALSHWNANTDNAWFWTGEDGQIDCGLFDWGNARVMNVGVALSGCFYGAEPEFIVENLDKGYESTIGEQGGKLSGGQRQRLALARAILKNPPVLILDEATSQIDPESESLIHETLAEFIRGRTTLMVTHRLSTLELADAILIMDQGKIVDYGTHEELLARCPTYQALRQTELRVAA